MTAQRQLEEHVRHTQRIESIGQLAGGIAHDFNNLLEVILGNSEMLIEDLASDPAKHRMAELVQTAALRASGLTQRMLAFSRRQELKPARVDCNTLVRGLVAMMKSTLGEDIELVAELAPDLWPVWVDRGELDTALVNLLVNARDAMPGGGRIAIRSENLPDEGRVRLTVTDTGAGMPPDVLERAFDPYFTTKEVGKGTGLGLSMVHGFVTQSGGDIALKSAPGSGTTVDIRLPRTPQETAADPVPTPAPAATPAATRSETVLVVEDEEMVRNYVAAELDRLGYRVIEARDGNEALAILRGESDIQLLFTDMVMPGGIRGNELARLAREIAPQLRVLFTTGYANAFDGKSLPGDEKIAVLHKPYQRRALADMVRRCLDEAV